VAAEDERTESATLRRETEFERLDRNFDDLLQELRVSQAGVQILFAFLLSLAFSQRFTEITQFQRNVYVGTLLCTTAATALIIGPVSYHRIVFGRKLKRHLVVAANRMAIAGLAFLVLALVGSVLLIVDVVFGNVVAGWVAAVTAAWFIVLWYVIPLRTLLKARSASTGQGKPGG
jgi:Family of unknown function (DUF6328)